MPLTESGEKVMADLVKQYGATKAKRIFYAMINEHKKGSEKWHKVEKRKAGKSKIHYNAA